MRYIVLWLGIVGALGLALALAGLVYGGFLLVRPVIEQNPWIILLVATVLLTATALTALDFLTDQRRQPPQP